MCTWFLVSVNCRSKTWFPCSRPGCALAACGASELSFVLSVPSGLAVGNEWLSLFCVGCDSKTVFLFSFHGVGEQSSLEDSSVVPGASPGPAAHRGPCAQLVGLCGPRAPSLHQDRPALGKGVYLAQTHGYSDSSVLSHLISAESDGASAVSTILP